MVNEENNRGMAAAMGFEQEINWEDFKKTEEEEELKLFLFHQRYETETDFSLLANQFVTI